MGTSSIGSNILSLLLQHAGNRGLTGVPSLSGACSGRQHADTDAIDKGLGISSTPISTSTESFSEMPHNVTLSEIRQFDCESNSHACINGGTKMLDIDTVDDACPLLLKLPSNVPPPPTTHGLTAGSILFGSGSNKPKSRPNQCNIPKGYRQHKGHNLHVTFMSGASTTSAPATQVNHTGVFKEGALLRCGREHTFRVGLDSRTGTPVLTMVSTITDNTGTDVHEDGAFRETVSGSPMEESRTDKRDEDVCDSPVRQLVHSHAADRMVVAKSAVEGRAHPCRNGDLASGVPCYAKPSSTADRPISSSSPGESSPVRNEGTAAILAGPDDFVCDPYVRSGSESTIDCLSLAPLPTDTLVLFPGEGLGASNCCLEEEQKDKCRGIVRSACPIPKSVVEEWDSFEPEGERVVGSPIAMSIPAVSSEELDRVNRSPEKVPGSFSDVFLPIAPAASSTIRQTLAAGGSFTFPLSVSLPHCALNKNLLRCLDPATPSPTDARALMSFSSFGSSVNLGPALSPSVPGLATSLADWAGNDADSSMGLSVDGRSGENPSRLCSSLLASLSGIPQFFVMNKAPAAEPEESEESLEASPVLSLSFSGKLPVDLEHPATNLVDGSGDHLEAMPPVGSDVLMSTAASGVSAREPPLLTCRTSEKALTSLFSSPNDSDVQDARVSPPLSSFLMGGDAPGLRRSPLLESTASTEHSCPCCGTHLFVVPPAESGNILGSSFEFQLNPAQGGSDEGAAGISRDCYGVRLPPPSKRGVFLDYHLGSRAEDDVARATDGEAWEAMKEAGSATEVVAAPPSYGNIPRALARLLNLAKSGLASDDEASVDDNVENENGDDDISRINGHTGARSNQAVAAVVVAAGIDDVSDEVMQDCAASDDYKEGWAAGADPPSLAGFELLTRRRAYGCDNDALDAPSVASDVPPAFSRDTLRHQYMSSEGDNPTGKPWRGKRRSSKSLLSNRGMFGCSNSRLEGEEADGDCEARSCQYGPPDDVSIDEAYGHNDTVPSSYPNCGEQVSASSHHQMRQTFSRPAVLPMYRRSPLASSVSTPLRPGTRLVHRGKERVAAQDGHQGSGRSKPRHASLTLPSGRLSPELAGKLFELQRSCPAVWPADGEALLRVLNLNLNAKGRLLASSAGRGGELRRSRSLNDVTHSVAVVNASPKAAAVADGGGADRNNAGASTSRSAAGALVAARVPVGPALQTDCLLEYASVSDLSGLSPSALAAFVAKRTNQGQHILSPRGFRIQPAQLGKGDEATKPFDGKISNPRLDSARRYIIFGRSLGRPQSLDLDQYRPKISAKKSLGSSLSLDGTSNANAVSQRTRTSNFYVAHAAAASNRDLERVQTDFDVGMDAPPEASPFTLGPDTGDLSDSVVSNEAEEEGIISDLDEASNTANERDTSSPTRQRAWTDLRIQKIPSQDSLTRMLGSGSGSLKIISASNSAESCTGAGASPTRDQVGRASSTLSPVGLGSGSETGSGTSDSESGRGSGVSPVAHFASQSSPHATFFPTRDAEKVMHRDLCTGEAAAAGDVLCTAHYSRTSSQASLVFPVSPKHAFSGAAVASPLQNGCCSSSGSIRNDNSSSGSIGKGDNHTLNYHMVTRPPRRGLGCNGDGMMDFQVPLLETVQSGIESRFDMPNPSASSGPYLSSSSSGVPSNPDPTAVEKSSWRGAKTAGRRTHPSTDEMDVEDIDNDGGRVDGLLSSELTDSFRVQRQEGSRTMRRYVSEDGSGMSHVMSQHEAESFAPNLLLSSMGDLDSCQTDALNSCFPPVPLPERHSPGGDPAAVGPFLESRDGDGNAEGEPTNSTLFEVANQLLLLNSSLFDGGAYIDMSFACLRRAVSAPELLESSHLLTAAECFGLGEEEEALCKGYGVPSAMASGRDQKGCSTSVEFPAVIFPSSVPNANLQALVRPEGWGPIAPPCPRENSGSKILQRSVRPLYASSASSSSTPAPYADWECSGPLSKVPDSGGSSFSLSASAIGRGAQSLGRSLRKSDGRSIGSSSTAAEAAAVGLSRRPAAGEIADVPESRLFCRFKCLSTNASFNARKALQELGLDTPDEGGSRGQDTGVGLDKV